MPTSCNLLWKSKKEAINCPRGDIKLAFCSSCTLITNSAIEPEKNQYGLLYDNSLFFSNHFQNFAKNLTKTLIHRYNLHNKTIAEVSCGKVDFLSLFFELGHNKILKYNPACTENKNANQNESLQADFVFSYHELEHANDPENFLNILRKKVGQNSKVRFFFAVPNALKAFEEGDYKDIIYEHVTYFTIPSLYLLFSRCGYNVSRIEETENEIFDSIYVESTSKKRMTSSFKRISKPAVTQIEECIQRFAAKSRNNIRRQKNRFTQLLNEGKRVVVWGAGARGVTFLNILKDERIEYAIDINPNKQGMYIPGMGQKIVSPEFLVNYQPDIVILANPAYKKEIKQLITKLSINTKLIAI